ncbi:zinc metalloproteinase nas-4 isoform X1 [Hydra vulgaris]|uniref:zinc metalloproteinase nas-4 isoform X1 n=1 Tax=Hydra vulgaris TaxID=6087 RepID=UPI0032EA5A42
MWQVFLISLCVCTQGMKLPVSLKNSKQIEYYLNEDLTDEDPIKIPTDAFLPQVGDIFEGDIVMDNVLRSAILATNTKKSVISSSMENGPNRWPNAVIPYDFDSTLLPTIKEGILYAIAELDKFTCVRFVPRNLEYDNDFVRFTSTKEGCSSSVGRQGGMQYVQLGNGCQRIGTVLHEMMHAIGFIHEQSRSDRNNYVDVKFDNIITSLIGNFYMYSFGNINNLNVPYNYWSVMHYSNDAFSKNGKDTLVAKVDQGLKFGQRTQLSHLDVQQINRLYPCPHPKVNHYDVDYLIQDMTPDVVKNNNKQV